MLTQLSPQPNTPQQPMPVMPPIVSSVQPPLPPTAVLTSTGSSAPQQKKPIGKILLIMLLLFFLVGGAAVALYLTSQKQEVRKQAEVEPTPAPAPFTFFPPTSGTSRLAKVGDETEIIGVAIDFDGNPTCNGSVCKANLKLTPESKPRGCRLNTANVVYYNLQTNPSDPNYPANVSQPSGGNNANCNRPLTDCSNSSDPNCEHGTQVAYGPPESQCPGGVASGCTYYVSELSYALRPQDLSCGCSQFDVSVAEISFLCQDDTQTVTYRKLADDTSIGGYAYGYSTAQCNGPTATPTTPPNATATPTTPPTVTVTPPGVRNTPTPTPTEAIVPTATPAPVGEMCVSISSNPTQPTYNDSVTFTCGAVSGITNYQFRYKTPGATQYQTLATAQSNQSQALRVNQAGQYVVQCRICPTPTAQYQYCNDPNWGWDTSQTTN